MPPPKDLKQLRGFLGRLQFVRRFISQHSEKCMPFNKLLKKGATFIWDEDCQKASDAIKRYLLNPPVLRPPVPGRPLILYIAVTSYSLGVVLAQQDDFGRKEYAVYYLSRTLVGAEVSYILVEKLGLVLVWTVHKLRHYFVAYTVHYLAQTDPIRYLF